MRTNTHPFIASFLLLFLFIFHTNLSARTRPNKIDPIRFTITTDASYLSANEEFEIKITAKYLSINPNLVYVFDGANSFKLKLIMPDGFKQTGGTYSDFIGTELTSTKPSMTYTVKGKFISENDGGSFQLLRGSRNASNQSEFVLIGSLAFTAISSSTDNLAPKYAKLAAVDPDYVPYMTLDEFRNGAGNNSNVVFINDGVKSGVFRFDSTNITSPDDSSMTLIYASKRYVRNEKGYVIPEWFGAKGDGISDDYLPMQKASDWLMKNGGGKYLLTSKKYLLSQQLLFRGYFTAKRDTSLDQTMHFNETPKVIIKSPNKSIIKATASMVSVIKTTFNASVDGAAPFYTNVEDVLIDGNHLADIGIIFDWTMHAKVENVSITNCDTGIQNADYNTSDTYGVTTIEGCVISANTCIKIFAGDCIITNNDLYPFQLGIYMAPRSGNTKITGNIFNNERGSGIQERTGIELYGVEDLTGEKEIRNIYIENNEFYAIHHCIKSNGHPVKSNYQIVISNNHAKGASYNWDITFIELYNSIDFIVENNFLGNIALPSSSASKFGIIYNSDRIEIRNNNIQNTSEEGIRLVNSTRCNIQGNTFQKIKNSAIFLYGASTDNTITDNKIYNPVSGYGYYFLNEQDTSDRNLADNNVTQNIPQTYTGVGADSYFIERIYSQTIPTTGYHWVGAIATNPKATAGSTYQWKCTVSGTPGTWKSLSTVSP